MRAELRDINAEKTFSIRFNNIGCKERCPMCGEIHKASIGMTIFDESVNMPICHECQEEHTPDLRSVLTICFNSVKNA